MSSAALGAVASIEYYAMSMTTTSIIEFHEERHRVVCLHATGNGRLLRDETEGTSEKMKCR